ncbi:SDR family oxidoreductase [Candidatus Collierbacteria bacterium]|nr:SDR family oxidoreductase [Candidatus Collierbacteria bacterium]
MKTYLITGGSGFIGSFICEKLLAENNHIICVDNFITGQRKNIEHLLSNPNFTLIEADVSKPDWIESTLNVQRTTLNFILHLASPAGPNPKSPKSYHALPVETYLVNSIGTHYLLELAKKHNAVFLFASTSEVYGDPEVHPQPETYWGHVNPIGPRAIYDESKRFGEAICAAWSRKFGLQTRIARIFNTYGPRMNPDDGRAIPLFIQSSINHQPLTIHGDGHQTRSFCYVDDQVEGLLKLLRSDLNADPVNIGNPVELTIKELADTIIRLTGSKSTVQYNKLPEDDPERRRPDISKAKKLLDWEPKVGLEEGLKKTIEYFRGAN